MNSSAQSRMLLFYFIFVFLHCSSYGAIIISRPAYTSTTILTQPQPMTTSYIYSPASYVYSYPLLYSYPTVAYLYQ
ncbi:unnamed protein product [Auanema sp. JU1783]|nr:unnamed protein product [Auanema sp. JU1783]